jgi:enoyl-CoA hydratase
VFDQAMACAQRIARLSNGAVEHTKRVVNIQLEQAVLATLDFAFERRGPFVHHA